MNKNYLGEEGTKQLIRQIKNLLSRKIELMSVPRSEDNGKSVVYSSTTGKFELVTVDSPSELNVTNGREIELYKSSEYILWRYVGEDTWKQLVPLSELKGDDGLITSITVNNQVYNHENGNITLPDYPEVPVNTSDLNNDSNFISVLDLNNLSLNLNGTNLELKYNDQVLSAVSLETLINK